MSRRFLEVLMVALLIMVTLGVAFQFQNQQTLQRILDEIEDQRVAGTAAPGRGELLAGGSGYPPGEPNSDWVRIEYGEDARPRRADSEEAGGEGRSGEEEPSRARPEPEPQGQRQASSEGAASPSGDAEFLGEALPDAAMRDSAAERDGEGESASTSDAASEETSAAADEPAESAEMGEADEEPSSTEREAVASADGAAESAPEPEPEPEPREEDPAWLEHEQLVTQTIEQLLAGDYGQVARRFTPQMARRLQPRQIAEALDPVRQSHGSMEELVSYENVTSGLDEGLHAFRVEVATTNDERLTFTITVDDNGEIDGLFMR